MRNYNTHAHTAVCRSMSRGRSASMAPPTPGSGLKDVTMRNKALKMADKAQWRMNKMAKAGRCLGSPSLSACHARDMLDCERLCTSSPLLPGSVLPHV